MPIKATMLDDIRKFLSQEGLKSADAIRNATKMSADEMNDFEGRTFEALRNLKNYPIRIHRGERGTRDILKSGRFKNQFETGSSAGFFSPSQRIRVENKQIGVPINTSKYQRPKYGLTGPDWIDEKAQSYGENVFTLKPESNGGRVTYSNGDTLDDGSVAISEPSMAWYGGEKEINDDKIYYGSDYKNVLKEQLNRLENGEAAPGRSYIEAQIHGELPLSDVSRLRVARKANKDEIEAADKFGFRLEQFDPIEYDWKCIRNCED